MACKQCNKPVSDSDRIVCRGYCGKLFHMICVHVDHPAAQQKNYVWMCDPCAELVANSHFRKMVGRYDNDIGILFESIKKYIGLVKDDVVAMKDDVEALKKDLAAANEDIRKLKLIVAALKSVATTCSVCSSQERLLPGAEHRFPLTTASHSKPILPQPSRGKKVLPEPTPAADLFVAPPDNRCWMWLGGFRNTMTEEKISEMVKKSLSCDANEAVAVKALVKNGVDITGLRSITFKVGVDRKYRDECLDPATWREGVLFREFVDLTTHDSSDEAALWFPETPRLNSPSA